MAVTLFHGDCLAVLKTIEENSISSIVCDPPYGLSDHSTDDISACLTAWINGQEYNHDKKGFMGKCYHPDTDILTQRGWIKIPEVNNGDLVASLNPNNHHLEYVRPIAFHSYDFNGDLCHIVHRGAEQLVTSNHNIYVARKGQDFRLSGIESLGRNFYLLNQAKYWEGRLTSIVIEDREFAPELFCYFLGLFLGDGYTCNRTNDHPANDFFGFGVTKPRKIKTIRETLIAMKIKFTETPGRKRTDFYCYDFPLLRWLKPLGKAYQKYIPSIIFDQPAVVLEHLYLGLMATDGCKQGKNQHVYYTVSSRLADDFQILCLHLGRSATCHIRPGGVVERFGRQNVVARDAYILSVLPPGKKLYAETHGRPNKQPRAVRSYPYCGEVYCVTLERNHILYTRFNRKPVWSGNSWDSFVPGPKVWKECLRVLKPGGNLLAFAGTRTMDLMGIAVRLAGFEIRDSFAWLSAQGMPKGLSIGRAIDKAAGATREVIGTKIITYDGSVRDPAKHGNPADQANFGKWGLSNSPHGAPLTAPATPEAAKWEGWNTSLRPSFEPCIMARKPLEGTVVQNVLQHGVGGYNIDACRLPIDPDIDDPRLGGAGTWGTGAMAKTVYGTYAGETVGSSPMGRFAPNAAHDGSEAVLETFASFGEKKSGAPGTRRKAHQTHSMSGRLNMTGEPEVGYGDNGSVARFFYAAKVSASERGSSKHPTQKPVSLMQYLIRLLTPNGGIVLDPFAGSGTTGQAALDEGFDVILIEREDEYVSHIRDRLGWFITDDIVMQDDV